MEYRIDELAQRAGTTSRNIRAHQARGLLPPPTLRGRTGWYDDGHLRRLELIDHLQERGFSLEAIKQTIGAWSQGGDLAQVLGLHALVTAPFTDEEPAELTAEELLERFPDAVQDPSLVQRAIDQGLVELSGDGFRVPSAVVIDAGAELQRAGIPLDAVLDMMGAVREDVADVASRFVDLAARTLVDPITEGRVTPVQIAESTETLQRLRLIAIEVVRALLAQEMSRAVAQQLKDLGLRLDPDGAG